MDEIRLIDANALKKYLKELLKTEPSSLYGRGLRLAVETIDDAPTVEITETEIQEVLNKRCMTAVANEYLVTLHGGRPHGEWKCPECGEWLFACPNCGAVMRPEKKVRIPSCLTNPERQAELLERYKEE